jgi:hypothetical protein
MISYVAYASVITISNVDSVPIPNSSPRIADLIALLLCGEIGITGCHAWSGHLYCRFRSISISTCISTVQILYYSLAISPTSSRYITHLHFEEMDHLLLHLRFDSPLPVA